MSVKGVIEKAMKTKLPGKRVNVLTTLANGDESNVVDYWIHSGNMVLDIVMTGGYPGDRFIELYGATSVGKTMLGAMFCAEVQAIGGIAVYADTEGTVDEEFFKVFGINTEELVYYIPKTVKEAVNQLKVIIDAKESMNPDMPIGFVWDSVAATSTAEEMKSDDSESKGYPTTALALSKTMRTLNTYFQEAKVTGLIVNQLKKKIGVSFGNTDSTYGGDAVGFYSSERLKIGRKSKITDKNNKAKILGEVIRISNTKNKVGVPHRWGIFPVYYGWGISEPESVLMTMKELGLYTVGGSTYTIETDIGQLKFKRSQFAEFMYRDDVYNSLFRLLSKAFRIPKPDLWQPEFE